ncbi:hypothetical protein ACFL0Z_03225, partial [Patescibacteria group bacterium]
MPTKTKIKRLISRHRGIFLVVSFFAYLAIVSLFFYLAQIQIQDLSAQVGRVAAITVGMNSEQLTAQAGADIEYSVDRNTGQLTFIRSEDGNLPVAGSPGLFTTDKAVTQQFMREYGGYFGLSNPDQDLAETKAQTDELGMFHIWYNQKHNNVPVFGGQASVHLEPDRAVSSANGRILPSI